MELQHNRQQMNNRDGATNREEFTGCSINSRKDLISSMRGPEAFIELVIGTRDPRWVARFSSIIADR